ncbi:hypothetical protein AAEO57_20735 [Flavobacterium sp. DGU38]|uniref:Uncharacterized protein n=1 Tax=Flavobacterium calami TaxID=3139144 RepID=A0ABU9IUU0_9FLAO
MEKLLYTIAGSVITLIITGLIKHWEKQENLKKQTQTLLQFIDNIIIKYLTISEKECNQILLDIDKDELFDSREMYVSPMLNKNIFDFFEKKELMKIFSYCKQNSLVELYHNFYEIDFLQQRLPIIILEKYTEKILDHFDGKKCESDTFETRNNCQYYQQQKRLFTREVEMRKNHTKALIESFIQIKTELKNIDELNDDE